LTWLAGGGDVAGQVLAVYRLDEISLTIAPAGNPARLRRLRRR
jgi:dihydrofolate reductase